jgi:hypothetical protein
VRERERGELLKNLKKKRGVGNELVFVLLSLSLVNV